MEVYLLNSDLEIIGVLDTFLSLIWTDRYWECGDFEISKIPDLEVFQLLGQVSYLSLPESEHSMILDTIEIQTDDEEGSMLIVSGKSLEYILERRIVLNPTVLSGDFQTAIELLLDENVINATDTDRNISLIEFQTTSDTYITSLEVDEAYWGENLYEVISSLCRARGVGFKITITDAGMFRFELYSGSDRSYNQSTNPWVVFSPSMENLLNSNFLITSSLQKTMTLVLGEKGIGNYRDTAEVEIPGGSPTGINRREMTTDAGDVSRNTPTGAMTDAEYLTLLQERGLEELNANTIIQSFDGEADTTSQFIFGEDFFMGDILQIINEYGNEAGSRIIEIIYSQNKAGIKVYPTFSTY